MFRRLDIDLAAPPSVRELAQHIAARGLPEGLHARAMDSCRLTPLRLPDGTLVEVRSFPGVSFAGSLFSESGARRCFAAANALLKAGLPVPEPFAWIDRRRPYGRVFESHYLSRQPRGFAEASVIERHPEAPDSLRIAGECGRLLRRLHCAGYCHPGRILFRTESTPQGGRLRFLLPDVQDLRPLSRRSGKPLEDIACLFLEQSLVLEAARAYAAEGAMDQEELEAEVLALYYSSHKTKLQ